MDATAAAATRLASTAWRGGRRWRGGALILVLVTSVAASGAPEEAAPALRLGSHPALDAGDFRVTTFAAGLPYTTAMQALPDGSLLVAVNDASEGGFINARGKLLRLLDHDGDGVADEIEPVGIVGRSDGDGPLVFQDLPDAVVQMRRIDDLLFVSSRGRSSSSITIMREAAAIGDPYQILGRLDFRFPLEHVHETYALAVRRGTEPDSIELYFNVGSRHNAESDTTPIPMTGLLDAELEPETVHRVTLIDDGVVVRGAGTRLIATGLRNAASLAFHPATGDLYIQDNGIDRADDPDEPTSADELNVIASEVLGDTVVDFGFPDDYVEYRTGTRIGSGGTEPLVAFQPIDASEAQGAAEMSFAPNGFPDDLADGLFIGFHGRYSLAGLENEENPLLYVDPGSGEYFEFIPNDLAGVGHLDNVLATDDALFIADLNSLGDLWTPTAEGVIYQIKALGSD